MTTMKRLLVYGVCLLAFITVGCGKQPIAGTSPTYAYEVRWNNQYYSVTVSPVKVVGKLLGTIQHFEINPTTPENNWSNFFPVGAKLYSVPGNSPNNKIAGNSTASTSNAMRLILQADRHSVLSLTGCDLKENGNHVVKIHPLRTASANLP